MKYVNRNHPLIRAAFILGSSHDSLWKDIRNCTRKAERNRLFVALERVCRIEAYIAEQYKTTPECWVNQ